MEFVEEREMQREGEVEENYGISGTAAGGGGRKSTGYGHYFRYRECLKNHAVGIGGHALDGCGEFMPAGEDGSLDALKCAACNCHRNFHRKVTESDGYAPHHHNHHQQLLPTNFSSYNAGYLHVPQPLAALRRDEEDMSMDPSGGGEGGSKKRFRTKFTAEQREKMMAVAEQLEWRIQKEDEAVVQQFCAEANLKRHVFKVWMHNNKHTLGNKKLPQS
ncbi:unnamed protein product [Cuscuta europaea]|uniref:ZF-HD dimerization-type domain-containing protein n=1 Tax=Cuscuta europaea TaxID=41803 RepID=A0A9P0VSX1_CUSEU|nr:unnamed protein product [Cuscuta europaea]